MKVNETEENIAEHESFHENILNMEKWLMIMKQKLDSFRASEGEWSIDNRQHEAEVLRIDNVNDKIHAFSKFYTFFEGSLRYHSMGFLIIE